MIGIIVISHGSLARELVKSTEMLMGESDQLAYEGIMPEDSSDHFYERVSALASRLDTGDGVAALVDLYGGTPCNTVARISRERNMRIVTGANLPMVMTAVAERTEEMTLNDFVAAVLAMGKESVAEFSV